MKNSKILCRKTINGGTSQKCQRADYKNGDVGNIHCHVKPYFLSYPCDRGYSDMDVFYLLKDMMCKVPNMPIPFIGVVISPTKQVTYPTIQIVCEVYELVKEEDLVGIKKGIRIINKEGEEKYFYIDKEEVKSVFKDRKLSYAADPDINKPLLAKQVAQLTMMNVKRHLLKNNLIKQYEVKISPTIGNGVTYKPVEIVIDAVDSLDKKPT